MLVLAEFVSVQVDLILGASSALMELMAYSELLVVVRETLHLILDSPSRLTGPEVDSEFHCWKNRFV